MTAISLEVKEVNVTDPFLAQLKSTAVSKTADYFTKQCVKANWGIS